MPRLKLIFRKDFLNIYISNAELRPSRIADTDLMLWRKKLLLMKSGPVFLLQYHRHDYIDSGCEISLLGCLPLLYTTDGFFQ